ncbi:PepSY domain-containing protein [Jeotgalibacillus malaysiensis]|uniref:PepSY domain-containing protein n=1 Tax=Jeotgalibacillus malaysiensis TaxID=1508404 RepID=UPI00384FFCB7
MNRKLIGTIAGTVILGGAFGANAVADQFKTVGIQDQFERTEVTEGTKTVQTNPEDRQSEEKLLSLEEAKEKALAAFEGVVESIELERETGRMVYDIDIDNGPEEVDLDMDAVTGEILRSKTDWDDDDDRNAYANTGDLLSKQEALDIATAEFNGKLEEIELDDDDGRMIYEIELKNGDREAEFDIDAVTGDILDMELDD